MYFVPTRQEDKERTCGCADQPEVAQVLFQQRSVVSVDVRFLTAERSVHDHISLSEISKEAAR
jgi:hypothetical protein